MEKEDGDRDTAVQSAGQTSKKDNRVLLRRRSSVTFITTRRRGSRTSACPFSKNFEKRTIISIISFDEIRDFMPNRRLFNELTS